jgi:hypothetical protein
MHAYKKGSLKPKHLKGIKVLVDTGWGTMLINKKFVKRLKTTAHSASKWNTKGGVFKTNRTVNALFALLRNQMEHVC